MTDRELMQQVLEAMETNQYAVADAAPHRDVMAYNDAITALQKKLARVEDDPDPLHLSRILHELAGAASLCWTSQPSGVFNSQEAIKHVEAAIQEIRERLAQPTSDIKQVIELYDRPEQCESCKRGLKAGICVCKQPEQEPVAWLVQYSNKHEFVWGQKPQWIADAIGIEPLYTTPQLRQWQGLTEEEVRKCFFRDDAPPSSPPYWWEYRNPDYRDIYALLDQALKEKNA